MKKVSLKDIAELSGFSPMTVSRVVNSPDTVSPATREKVEKIIAQLNYQPNIIARALTTGKTRNIGLLVFYDAPHFPSAFMSSFLKGVSDVVQSHDHHLILLFQGHEDSFSAQNVSTLSANKMDGLLILSVDSSLETLYPLYLRWRDTGLPVVVVNQKLDDPQCSYVATDDFSGGFQAASHLIERGHRRIGMITGSDQYATSLNRFKGFIRALESHGLMFDPNAYAEGGYTKEGGYSAMEKLLSRVPEMTAVCCASDLMALGAMKCCAEKGVSIPEQISIVGYDDQEFSSMLSPALTTVRKKRESMGREAADILMRLLSGESGPIRSLMKAEVIQRESVRRIESNQTNSGEVHP